MGCIQSKRAHRRVAPVSTENSSSADEVTLVQSIYLPLSLQPSMEEPRKRKTEQEVLKELKDEGLLKCETLKENANGNVAFYVSLDGNPYPLGKPRFLEPIELKQEREKLRANLKDRMTKAAVIRRQSLSKVRRKARIVSAKQRQAVVKKGRADEEHRRIHRERLERKMERASRNRQSRMAGGE